MRKTEGYKKIYYRRKNKKIIMEGKQDNKTILIWTLPEPEELFNIIIGKSSFLSAEKLSKINEKIQRLDIRQIKYYKDISNIPLIKIKRSQKKDLKSPIIKKELTEEERKLIAE